MKKCNFIYHYNKCDRLSAQSKGNKEVPKVVKEAFQKRVSKCKVDWDEVTKNARIKTPTTLVTVD
jgi:hypothetical protein